MGEDGREKRCTIRGLSSRNEIALQGEQWMTCTLSEAAEHEAHILSKYFGTRVSLRTYLPTTPKQKAAWLRELSEAGQSDSRMGVETFVFPRSANPLYDHANYEREKIRAEKRAKVAIGPHATAVDDPMFAEQFEGMWVFYTGRVLPFERKRNELDPRVMKPVLPRSDIWVSVDYGYEDPASAGFWAVTPMGLYVRFAEVYERRLHTGAFVDRIREVSETLGVRPRITTGDPSRPEVSELMAEAGIPPIVMDKNAQRDRAAGKQRICDLMLAGPQEGDPGLYVTSDCPQTIYEWEHLHYSDKYQDENATSAFKGEDHAYDDTRYFRDESPPPDGAEAARELDASVEA